MKKLHFLFVMGLATLFITSCSSYRHSMREPNSHVEFVASDFEFSEPVSAEATVSRILWIDWERTFGSSKAGFVNSGSELPIIGNMIYGGANIALYKLIQQNPGYDVIFYPKVEVKRHAPFFGSSFYSTTTYKVTARLGKLKQK